MIVHDAATAFIAVIRAARLWVRVFAAVAGFVVIVTALCVGPLAAQAVLAVWRRARRPLWARNRLSARIHARRRVRAADGRSARPAPSWAHTDHHDDYREAA